MHVGHSMNSCVDMVGVFMNSFSKRNENRSYIGAADTNIAKRRTCTRKMPGADGDNPNCTAQK